MSFLDSTGLSIVWTRMKTFVNNKAKNKYIPNQSVQYLDGSSSFLTSTGSLVLRDLIANYESGHQVSSGGAKYGECVYFAPNRDTDAIKIDMNGSNESSSSNVIYDVVYFKLKFEKYNQYSTNNTTVIHFTLEYISMGYGPSRGDADIHMILRGYSSDGYSTHTVVFAKQIDNIVSSSNAGGTSGYLLKSRGAGLDPEWTGMSSFLNVQKHTKGSINIAASAYVNSSMTLAAPSGYKTAIAVVGFSTNWYEHICFTKCYISGTTLNYGLRNVDTSAHTVQLTVYVLWV